MYRVRMPRPVLLPSLIPTTLGKDRAIDEPLATPIGVLDITCVSMGNPHAVVFHDEVDNLDLDVVGSAIETHPAFPRRTNVEFVQLVSPRKACVRVWERGCGETMACGSGACAVAVASKLVGRGEEKMEIVLMGGSLFIEWAGGDEPVFMTGTAHRSFSGKIDTGDLNATSTQNRRSATLPVCRDR
ncbi:MAG: diaminopimelate epimerase [Planctomycetota bacterium]|nr:diaminopimelate epimerase [Planctomycetota bacterium]